MRWFTEFIESLRIAGAAIKANKVRGCPDHAGDHHWYRCCYNDHDSCQWSGKQF